MKQALVRHTDFLARGWGGGGRLVSQFIKLLNVYKLLSVSLHRFLQSCDRPANALIAGSFQLLYSIKQKVWFRPPYSMFIQRLWPSPVILD